MVVKLSAVDTSSCHQALKKVTRVTAEKRKLMHSIADYFLIWACCREAEIQSAA